MNNHSPGKSEAQVSVRDVASVIFRHKLLLCVTFLAVALGTAAITFLMPNEYESRMKILVKNTRSDVPITPEQTIGSTGNNFENDVSENQINSEIELLNGNNLLQNVVTKCALNRRQNVAEAETSARRSIAVENAVKRLQHDLKISPRLRLQAAQAPGQQLMPLPGGNNDGDGGHGKEGDCYIGWSGSRPSNRLNARTPRRTAGIFRSQSV